ncbi:MAG: hypothetical protein RLZZ271_839 [Pseudomonadota bacterium]|jgi:aspartyl protease family protein
MNTGRKQKIAWLALWSFAFVATAWVGTSVAQAQFPSVRLGGILGGKALLVIESRPPKAMSPGQSHEGIKLISVGKDHAVIEINGVKETLRMGESPLGMAAASKEESGSGQRIVLQAGRGGHFTTGGQINGQYVEFMVDTGATRVSMSADHAQAFGVSYKNSPTGIAHTANGTKRVYLVTLDSVRIGSVTLHNVEASVSDVQMPFILLGNSFLSRFNMQQNNGQLVLEKRY